MEELEIRRLQLTTFESDLRDRLHQRFAPLGDARTSDPLYQRMWFALARVQRGLAKLEQELAARHG